jgi:HSP20 family molecular chaperone IbpA
MGEMVEVKHSSTPEKARETIFDELRRDFADWMTANQDMVWRPTIELMKEGMEFAARVLLPGVDPGDIEVMVAPDILLIKGETRGRKMLKSIKFPRPVNPDEVHAELKDGMLTIRAKIAGASKVRVFVPRAA